MRAVLNPEVVFWVPRSRFETSVLYQHGIANLKPYVHGAWAGIAGSLFKAGSIMKRFPDQRACFQYDMLMRLIS